jgi:hypothetical protein
VQIFLARWDIFQQDTVLQRNTFHQHIADRKRIKHPILQGIVFQNLFILYVVLIGLPVAYDIQIEEFFYGIFVSLECRSIHRLSQAQVRFRPTLIYFLISYPACPIDYIGKPNVLLKDSMCLHDSTILQQI